ncbi:hypothetical protein AB205_0014530 [Aquarana catesbeiana]|uniref:Uncharacterized protein n=1 Tax=Aquarana catesbeiana TaxID=8400 RepID=A0A2G9R2A0_AQUCT|nr:hypothetical protein AB205_0014530 [Aquarana catesbeiana]
MFHIPISGIKCLCAKYTFFNSHGDVDFVEEGSHFTSENAQILIEERMGCKHDLENLKQNINDVPKKMKNIIDIFWRI